MTLPLVELSRDWSGRVLDAPPRCTFGIDHTHLHFRAKRNALSTVHPSAKPGCFHAELWKYDVAEFFLRAPDSATYLEINLAPNGAWWSCLFTAPRRRLSGEEHPIPGVFATATRNARDWEANMAIPLSFLQKTLDFGPSSQLHAAFLLDQPQRCLTTGTPPEGEPDFHHPALPESITFAPLPDEGDRRDAIDSAPFAP